MITDVVNMITDVKKWLNKDGRIFLEEIGIKEDYFLLDFGCSEGHYTIPLAKVVGKNGRVYALDKDKEVLDKLKKTIFDQNIKNIELINKDSKIPLEDNFLDVVLGYDVIHYQNRKQRINIYKEICRVLKKDGLFSVYPKHHKDDYPLMELAEVSIESIIKEIEEAGFLLKYNFLKTVIHDGYYNEGYVLNFRRF